MAQADRGRLFDREAQRGPKGYEWLRWSTERIGHRLTGSPQGAMAEHTADSIFRSIGLDRVSLFPFQAQAWSRGRIDVTITGESLDRARHRPKREPEQVGEFLSRKRKPQPRATRVRARELAKHDTDALLGGH